MPLESNELSSEIEQVADYHVPNISAVLLVDATYKQNSHVNISVSGSGGGHSATDNSGDSEEDKDEINDTKDLTGQVMKTDANSFAGGGMVVANKGQHMQLNSACLYLNSLH